MECFIFHLFRIEHTHYTVVIGVLAQIIIN